MKTQEMLNSKQAYEHPWTESVILHVENFICSSPGPGTEDTEEEYNP